MFFCFVFIRFIVGIGKNLFLENGNIKGWNLFFKNKYIRIFILKLWVVIFESFVFILVVVLLCEVFLEFFRISLLLYNKVYYFIL